MDRRIACPHHDVLWSMLCCLLEEGGPALVLYALDAGYRMPLERLLWLSPGFLGGCRHQQQSHQSSAQSSVIISHQQSHQSSGESSVISSVINHQSHQSSESLVNRFISHQQSHCMHADMASEACEVGELELSHAVLTEDLQLRSSDCCAPAVMSSISSMSGSLARGGTCGLGSGRPVAVTRGLFLWDTHVNTYWRVQWRLSAQSAWICCSALVAIGTRQRSLLHAIEPPSKPCNMRRCKVGSGAPATWGPSSHASRLRWSDLGWSSQVSLA